MSPPVVSARHISKAYNLGRTTLRHDALRDQISAGFQGLARGLANRFRRSNGIRKKEQADDIFWALKDVSFDVRKGEIVGIIGANGAGKSTLLKVLSEITEPTEGEVRVSGRMVSLLEVGTGFHPELTGRENIFLNGSILGMSKAEIESKFDEIVSFAGVERFLQTPVKRYSSGMYVRLAFSVAAFLEPEILVVDEVLSVGDAAFQRKSLGKMSEVAGHGRTVFFVSHNMGAVSNLCTRGIVMDHGRILFDGAVGEALQMYNSNILYSNEKSGQPLHVLFHQAVAEGTAFAITKIEVFDLDGNPKPIVATGDALVLRIAYFARTVVPRASIELQFNGPDGSRLLYLAMDPDSGFSLTIEPGEHSAECVIESLPFAGGHYVIGGGIVVPHVEHLAWTPNMCRLNVLEHDVYESGFLLWSERSLITTAHYWRTL